MKYQNEVLVVEYNSEWKDQFNMIKEYVWSSIADSALSIEHVGSTSVPGLAAKPVIDVDIVVKDKEQSNLVIQRLENLGFQHRGNLGIEGREAFSQLPQFPKHNLYVCLSGCLALENHLRFRDYLLQNPDAVKEYSKLKFDLANKTKDMGLYIEGKTKFITAILAQTGISQDDLRTIDDLNSAD